MNGKTCFCWTLGIFLALKIILLITYHDTRWDESVAIGMGKYLYSGGKIGLWEPIRPIGLPILLGFLWTLNLNMILAVEIISIIFSGGVLYLTYLISRSLFREELAWIPSFMVAITPIFFYLSSYGFSHTPSVFFSLLGTYFIIKKRYFLGGVFIGLSFMFRFTQGILLVCFIIWIVMFRKEKMHTISHFVAGYIIPVLPFLIHNYYFYGNPLLPFMDASLHQNNLAYSMIDGSLKSYLYNLLYYFVQIIKQSPLLILFLVSPIFMISKKAWTRTHFLFFIIISFMFIGYLTYIINKQERFLLDFLPYLAILSTITITEGYNRLFQKKKQLFSIIIIGCLSIPFMTAAVQYGYRFGDVPEIERIYHYFDHVTRGQTVFSMTPIPVAYSDMLIVPMYNNIEDAVNIYETQKEKIEVLVYSTEFYPCFEKSCQDKRDTLYLSIKNRFKSIYNITSGQEYIIYAQMPQTSTIQ